MDSLLSTNPLTPIRQPVAVPSSRAWLWGARVFTGLIVAFLLVDAVFKLIAPAPIVEATRQLGFAVGVIRPLGVLLAVFAVLHVIPRTELLGALLLTAYLGGATATHVRAGTPSWFPVAMGAILWIAYGVRSPSLRALLFSPRAR
jgi:hypothetical protein